MYERISKLLFDKGSFLDAGKMSDNSRSKAVKSEAGYNLDKKIGQIFGYSIKNCSHRIFSFHLGLSLSCFSRDIDTGTQRGNMLIC